MNKKLIHFISTLFLITNYGFCSSMNYCKLANKIVSNYSRALAKEKGLFLVGRGGAMMDDIKKINVVYTSFAALNVEEARKLYVEVSEEYLKRINKDEKIRAYLHNYPFRFDNVDLSISFYDENNERQGNGNVALIFRARKNEINSEGYDFEKKDFYSLHRESYEEALKIVLEEPNQ